MSTRGYLYSFTVPHTQTQHTTHTQHKHTTKHTPRTLCTHNLSACTFPVLVIIYIKTLSIFMHTTTSLRVSIIVPPEPMKTKTETKCARFPRYCGQCRWRQGSRPPSDPSLVHCTQAVGRRWCGMVWDGVEGCVCGGVSVSKVCVSGFQD